MFLYLYLDLIRLEMIRNVREEREREGGVGGKNERRCLLEGLGGV